MSTLRLILFVSMRVVVLTAWVLSSGGIGVADLRPGQQTAPRVVGTAQSNDEFEAYQKVLDIAEPNVAAKRAESFLQMYPDSGLSPYVHQAAVFAYQNLKDRASVIRHGEAVLQDLPDNSLVLSILARTFAEMEQPGLSIARGSAALQAAGEMPPPRSH